MGEVYRAFDLKLRVDVALKSVRPELLSSEKARELLRGEVRSAREVVSPNVCRIFDLVVEGGQELVSMEYIDGTTLAETFLERGPLELREAREIAAQFLSGLEAIHEAGLVHRDFKPENVMLTRAGRVVVMDFGLAKAHSEGQKGKSKSIAGTPAYMSPEQSRGEPVDARADVFSAGVVLAEMLWEGPRPALWQRVRETPPQVPEGPWAPVLRQALSRDRESRIASARALARALDEVTHRLPGFEDKHPYPGLASFTQEDAEYFFGREMEVEAVWKKLKRPRLLALIGPSGAGKSSFLRAGLLPTLPPGWRVLLSTPGHRPFSALAEGLLPAFAGDMQAIQSFLRFDEPETAVSLFSAWRQKSEHALVIVDQFEELFTLNPPEVQEAFSILLGRLVLEADVHVLLALRDDFLFHCQKHDALSPVFSELTPLGTLSPSALRRALVQPALACGYRFEDEALVEEMVSEVSRERGVLPLLAFAASRLWDKRDRERGLLTRAAYQEIGGVGGALARHAEETLEKIGTERTPLVRELFRNLVTAQGTRASREVEELLSIFPSEGERKAAEEVLRELVAARLLTSYEDSVEIIHESLLSAWPRLVQWRNQDEGGALLRDQLRQAAHIWAERGRADDLLWTGSSFREFELWKERYPGSLTMLEEDFTKAMTTRATRTRRRRRLAITASLLTAFGVAAVTLALWRQSETARRAAEEEARNREAAQLLSLGRLRLEDHPSAAIAYALASLERADNEPARQFAVEALWRGPTEFVFGTEDGAAPGVRFSPDGRFMAYGTPKSARLQESEGGPSRALVPGQNLPSVDFSDDSNLLLVVSEESPLRRFSMPEASELGSLPLGDPSTAWFPRGDSVLTIGKPDGSRRRAVLSLPFSGGTARALGTWDARDVTDFDVTSDGSRIAAVRDGRLSLTSVDRMAAPRAKEAGENEGSVWANRGRPEIATIDREGRAIRIWSVEGEEPKREREIFGLSSETIERVALDPRGRFMSARIKSDRLVHRLWDLDAPPDTEPLALRDRDTEGWLMGTDFDPSGRWLAVVHAKYGTLWALHEKKPRVLRGLAPPFLTSVAFSPDGRHLVSASYGGEVWRFSLEPGGLRTRLFDAGGNRRLILMPSFDRDGRFIVVDQDGRVLLIRLDGRVLAIDVPTFAGHATLQRDGRILAVGLDDGRASPDILVRDLETGDERTFSAVVEGEGCATDRLDAGGGPDLVFLPDGRLLTEGGTGFQVIDLTSGASTPLRPCRPGIPDAILSLAPDARILLIAHVSEDTARTSEIAVFDLETRAEWQVVSHGEHVTAAILDPTGRLIVTGSGDGLVRVGPLEESEEPHLLYGHTARVTSVAVSPDSRWIASAAEDGTIRLWPIPDGRPLQTLPYEELLAKLRSLTNLRVVPDAGSATGYKVEPGPFPGWAKFPEW
jgi:WD40 repeat protein